METVEKHILETEDLSQEYASYYKMRCEVCRLVSQPRFYTLTANKLGENFIECEFCKHKNIFKWVNSSKGHGTLFYMVFPPVIKTEQERSES